MPPLIFNYLRIFTPSSSESRVSSDAVKTILGILRLRAGHLAAPALRSE